ncbi:MAG: tyrosine-protein phosphatase [Chloroflexi bacterium]|nr:tyrosine-protein phosphatase [Chloroflexota bacterium]
MPHWVVEGQLAASQRPGYRPGPELLVHPDEVEHWTRSTQDFGIASIICLLSDDQLPLYRKALPSGLIAHYQASGFSVHHLPTFDGQTHPFTNEQYEQAWEAFQNLPKPVLVHCSAGMDRTGRIIQHIVQRMRESEPVAASAAGG